jgi:hypothetical protein
MYKLVSIGIAIGVLVTVVLVWSSTGSSQLYLA